MIPSFQLAAGLRQAACAQTALSPRLQQAVRMLQLPTPDYVQLLRQAVCDNPFLEWAEEGWPGADSGAGTDTEDAAGNSADASDAGLSEVGEVSEGAAGADADAEIWLASPGEGRASGEGGSPGDALQNRLPCLVTLAEHLAGQLRLLRLPERERLLALALVECLDEDGYLRMPLAELGPALPGLRPAPQAHELSLALARVQALEPAGVGARSLGECLALQLDPGRDASGLACAPWMPTGLDSEPPKLRALALVIVREHLPALAAGDLVGLSRRLGQTLCHVQAACDRIRRLDPRPGSRIGGVLAATIIPDVVVRRRESQWVAHLNPVALPRLRLQQTYADWYASHREQGGVVFGRHLQEARWTLRNVEQRFATILAVARAILQRQHRFLALGPLALRPLALREIAQEVGVHESTVSRVTHQKYMATPCGLFELRFFFSRGLATDSGGHCSPTAVRGLIRALVASEPRETPLSDVALARALTAQGLRVARRTVTKYRQQLHIEPAARRGPSIR